jgi:enoyl-CoA hydratase
MSFTGRFIDAKTAYEWGLVNRVVPAADLLDEAVALAARIASLDAGFLRDYNELIDTGYDLPFTEALACETAFSTARNTKVTADSVEARRAGVLARGRTQV